MTVKFLYNNVASLRELFDKHPRWIAGVILEAEASAPQRRAFHALAAAIETIRIYASETWSSYRAQFLVTATS